MVYFKGNYFSEISEGFHRLPRGGGGGGELFSGVGVKMLISIETYRNFPGGGGGAPDPIPPLDPRMHSYFRV